MDAGLHIFVILCMPSVEKRTRCVLVAHVNSGIDCLTDYEKIAFRVFYLSDRSSGSFHDEI